MKRLHPHHILLALVLTFASATGLTSELDQHLSVSGIEIYYGIVPAAVVQDLKANAPVEADMHGKAIHYPGSHHLIVSLYDTASGRRLTDATVTATVSTLGYRHEEKPLTLMTTGSVQSYGNFFRMSGSDTYRVDLNIQPKGTTPPITARFSYRQGQ